MRSTELFRELNGEEPRADVQVQGESAAVDRYEGLRIVSRTVLWLSVSGMYLLPVDILRSAVVMVGVFALAALLLSVVGALIIVVRSQ